MARRIRLLTQIAVATIVLAAPGWSNVGNDSGRAANSPSETTITPAAARNLRVRWHTNLGQTGPPPVAAGGRVFALANAGTDADELRAYPGANGGCTAPGVCSPTWSVRAPVLSALAYAGGLVRAGGARYQYANSSDPFFFGWLYYGGGYDPATGADAGGGVPSEHLPVVAGGCVYGYVDNAFYRGTPFPYFYTSLVRWGVDSSCTSATIQQAVAPMPTAVASHRIYQLARDQVWVSDETPDQCRLSYPCGGNLWTAHLSARAAFDAMPTVARGRLFVPTLDGGIDVFPTSGCGQYECAPAYRLRAGTVHIGSLAVTDTRVFAASDDGHLYAFRPAGCGAAVCDATWTSDLGTPLHSPSVAGDVVYVPTDDGRVFAVDARGCGAKACPPLGSAATGARIRWAPVISGGRVYVLNDAGDLYALGGG